MPKQSAELNVLVTSEPDIAPGLALADRIATRGVYRVMVTVVSDSSSILVKQVEARIASMPEVSQTNFNVEDHSEDVDALIEDLDGRSALRVLLVPGLEQLNDNRRKLIRKVHASVICFETHPGLDCEPESLYLVGNDEKGEAAWLSEQLCPNPELIPASEDLLRERQSAEEGDRHDKSDWVIMIATDEDVEAVLRKSKAVVESAVGPVLLLRGEPSWPQWLLHRFLPAFAIRYVPQMEKTERRELAKTLEKHSSLDFDFIALICASTFLAAFGLVQNSAAVIIGAMLVAPLMTPILGAGLSLSQGNRPLFANSLKTILVGFCAALVTSCLFGLLVRLIAPSIFGSTGLAVILTSEMWSRTHPTSVDFLVGLVGGSAAAYARTRSYLADALAGAAIAAALVPPIATAGLYFSLIGRQLVSPSGESLNSLALIHGPILLFVANMLTIMIGSSFVLWICGVRGDHSHSQRERWSTRATVLLMTLAVVVLVLVVQFG